MCISDLLGSLQETYTNNLFSSAEEKGIKTWVQWVKQAAVCSPFLKAPPSSLLVVSGSLFVCCYHLFTAARESLQSASTTCTFHSALQLPLKPVPKSVHRDLILLPWVKWSLNESTGAGGLKQSNKNSRQEAIQKKCLMKKAEWMSSLRISDMSCSVMADMQTTPWCCACVSSPQHSVLLQRNIAHICCRLQEDGAGHPSTVQLLHN